jgi:hypothetical protein
MTSMSGQRQPAGEPAPGEMAHGDPVRDDAGDAGLGSGEFTAAGGDGQPVGPGEAGGVQQVQQEARSAQQDAFGTAGGAGGGTSLGQQVAGGQAAMSGGGRPAAGEMSVSWREIQAVFVDNPRGAVEQASAVTEQAVAAFVDALRRRQASLAEAGPGSAGDGAPDGTERLRAALQRYRAFCEQLDQLDQQLAGRAGDTQPAGSTPAAA